MHPQTVPAFPFAVSDGFRVFFGERYGKCKKWEMVKISRRPARPHSRVVGRERKRGPCKREQHS